MTFHFGTVCVVCVCIIIWINRLVIAVTCDCPLTLTPGCVCLPILFSIRDILKFVLVFNLVINKLSYALFSFLTKMFFVDQCMNPKMV